MTINQRQRARRMADKRRPVYHQAMYIAGVGAVLASYAAGLAPGPMTRFILISIAVICGAAVIHCDLESRREY